MANKRVIEMIISAKNAAGAVFDEARKGLGGVGKSAEEAGDSMREAGEQSEEAAGGLEKAGREGQKAGGILAKLGKTTTSVASALGKGAREAVDFGTSAGKAGKGGVNVLLHNLANLTTVAGAVMGAVSGLAGAVGESLARSAERGDAGALQLLGTMGKARQALDKVTAVVAEQLVPSLGPLISMVADVALATAKWIQENRVVEQVIQIVIGATIGLLRALDKGSIGLKTLAEIGRVAFAKAMGLVQASIAKTIEVLSAMIREAAVFSQVLDQDVADSLFRTMDRLDRQAAAWRRSAEASGETRVQMIETQGVMGRMADTLEDVSDKISGASESGKQASLEMLAYSEQGMARLEAMMQVELARAGENREARLAIIRKYQALEAQVGREGSQRYLELQTEAETILTEMKIREAEARLAQELQLNEGNSEALIGVWERHLDRIQGLYEERGPEIMETETQILLARQALHEENAEKLKETMTEYLDWYNEKTNEWLERQVEDIEFQRELGVEEEEIIRHKMALYQELADNASLSAEQRMQAEKAVTDLQRQQHKIQVKSAIDTAQKQIATAVNMTKVLIETTGSLKERVTAFFKQMAASVIDSMAQQAAQAVALAAQQAAGVEAAAVRERMAALGPIGALVAKAHAHIPFVGPVIAAAVLAAFMSMAKKVVKFNTGGMVPGSGGPVPGTGFSDSVPAELTPGEYVIRRESAARIGQPALDQANETGQLPAGGAAAAGPRRLLLEVGFKDVNDSQTAQFLANLLNFGVRELDIDLVASDFLQPS